MKIYTNEEGNVVLDYEGKWPIEPLEISVDNAVITNALLKIKGGKAPLLDSLRAAWIAFLTVRYGEFVDEGESTKYINNIAL